MSVPSEIANGTDLVNVVDVRRDYEGRRAFLSRFIQELADTDTLTGAHEEEDAMSFCGTDLIIHRKCFTDAEKTLERAGKITQLASYWTDACDTRQPQELEGGEPFFIGCDEDQTWCHAYSTAAGYPYRCEHPSSGNHHQMIEPGA